MEMMCISKKEYDRLVERDKLLNCFEKQNVQGWDGWEDAIDEYNNYDEEEWE